ncbi:OmpA family protein [Ferrimonas pelagia]|uniref:OmpA family protein n=1 Tax=Ferrimonas pelagia TaxID=1177826 RepID=A0ABP9EJJ9_9GAMM
MKLNACATALMATLVFPLASADDTAPWYAGVGFGQSNWNGTCPASVTAAQCDDTDFAWDLFGGWQFSRFIGVELGYTDLGKSRWDSQALSRTTDGSGVRLALTGRAPLMDNLFVVAEAGGFWHDLKIRNAAGSFSDDEIDPYLGAGLDYRVNQQLQLGVRFRHFHDMEVTEQFSPVEANYWGLQLSYHFGASPAPVAAAAVAPVVAPAKPATPPPPVQLPEPVVIPPATTVYFAFDSAELSGEERDKLKAIGRFMQEQPDAQAQIMGHTDGTGSNDYNIKLGERRADSVKQALHHDWQIDPARMKTGTLGERGAKPEANRPDRHVTINVTLE